MFEFYINIFDKHIYSILEDIFIILMLYTFIKLILLSSLVELIWPTQFFNKRNSNSVTSFRLRTLVEIFNKLRLSCITIPTLLTIATC